MKPPSHSPGPGPKIAGVVTALVTPLIPTGAGGNSVDRCLARLAVLARCGVGAGVVTLPFNGWSARRRESADFLAAVTSRSPDRVGTGRTLAALTHCRNLIGGGASAHPAEAAVQY